LLKKLADAYDQQYNENLSRERADPSDGKQRKLRPALQSWIFDTAATTRGSRITLRLVEVSNDKEADITD